VLPTDTVSFILNHGFSPTLTGSVNYYASRGNGTGAQPAQSALSLSLSKQLSPDLSLQAAYQHSDALNLAGSSNAHSNSFNVSLRYALSKLERSH
jgi:predicted porin